MSQQRPTTTVLAVVAFGLCAIFGNILLARLCLAQRMIDAGSFTTIRLLSGAIALIVIVQLGRRKQRRSTDGEAGPKFFEAGSWAGALALFLYAAPYSYAYLELHAGIGAFAFMSVVQVFMITWGIVRGERPRPLRWLGLFMAMSGLAFLALPGSTRPDPLYTALMIGSGLSWGIYSVLGIRSKGPPLMTTAANFTRTIPMVGVLILGAGYFGLHVEPLGALCAVVSGVFGSAIGYAIWYVALRGLTASMAAISQLSLPALVAGLGSPLLGEPITGRVLGLGAAMLGGVGLAIYARESKR